jgi:SAM-dependent methyltransferase
MTTVMTRAEIQGALWGAKAEDWAELQEPAWTPIFERGFDLAGLSAGASLLDIGCGAGGALALARRRGAHVAGIDASANLVAVARRRLPGARVEIGDMEALPFAMASFDIVAGFNSIQFAADPIRALSETRRVCRPDGTIFVLAWGKAEDCELVTMVMWHVTALLPQSRSAAGVPMTDRASIEDALRAAEIEPIDGGEFAGELLYPDADVALRALLSAGITIRAAQAAGEARVSEVIWSRLGAAMRSDGAIVFRNRFCWVKGRNAGLLARGTRVGRRRQG